MLSCVSAGVAHTASGMLSVSESVTASARGIFHASSVWSTVWFATTMIGMYTVPRSSVIPR